MLMLRPTVQRCAYVATYVAYGIQTMILCIEQSILLYFTLLNILSAQNHCRMKFH